MASDSSCRQEMSGVESASYQRLHPPGQNQKTKKRIGAFSIAAREHARKAGIRATRGREKGQPKERQHSGPKETRDRLPHASVFRFRAGSSATVI
jgi:hypothetical protein